MEFDGYMTSKNNRRDHVARVQPKSDPNSQPDNPPSEPPPIIPISSTPLPAQMNEDKLSWIDGMKPGDTPISRTSEPIQTLVPSAPPAPPPEHRTPFTPPPIHQTHIVRERLVPPESEVDKIISPAPLSRRSSVWDGHIPPFIPETHEQSHASLLARDSIIVSSAPPSPPKNVPNLPPEMEWLAEYAATRNAIKLDKDRDEK